MDKQIIVYEADKDHRIEVKTDGDTVWLTQEQMCQLFGRTQPVIARHIANVFKEGELPKEGFMQILHKTSQVGGRPIAIYNLDVVISVGYRVKSFQGTRFRQWATRVLREMLLNRLDEVKRIGNLERRMDAVEGDIKQIKGGMNYLVKQLSAPPAPPRKRIGFNNGNASSAKPYGKK
jgi:hypothetical protein